MTRIQMFAVLVVYLLGMWASCAWAVSLGASAVLGLILWTSFFAFCNALTWGLWWSREHWLP